MKKLILILMVAVFGYAQPTPLGFGEVVRVIEVKQGDPATIFRTLQGVFSGVSLNDRMLIVRGPVPVVDTIEEAIKKLDAASTANPVVNVELTVQLLYGSADESAGGPIPTDLDSTVRQLRALFPYKSYRVMDTWVLRARDGRDIQQQGTLPGGGTSYNFSAVPSVRPGGAPRTVGFQNLQFRVGNSSNIQTSLDIREGQKTVVGKSNFQRGASDDAIILVISTKVI